MSDVVIDFDNLPNIKNSNQIKYFTIVSYEIYGNKVETVVYKPFDEVVKELKDMKNKAEKCGFEFKLIKCKYYELINRQKIVSL